MLYLINYLYMGGAEPPDPFPDPGLDPTPDGLDCAGTGPFICGDPSNDGVINSADVVYLINYLFISGPPPVPMAVGDVNCDGKVDVTDVVYLINSLFVAGSPPPCSP